MIKPNPENCKNCPHLCAYHCAQLSYTTQSHMQCRPHRASLKQHSGRSFLINNTFLTMSRHVTLNCTTGLVKHLLKYTGLISEWMTFALFFLWQRITECYLVKMKQHIAYYYNALILPPTPSVVWNSDVMLTSHETNKEIAFLQCDISFSQCTVSTLFGEVDKIFMYA